MKSERESEREERETVWLTTNFHDSVLSRGDSRLDSPGNLSLSLSLLGLMKPGLEWQSRAFLNFSPPAVSPGINVRVAERSHESRVNRSKQSYACYVLSDCNSTGASIRLQAIHG